MDIEALQIKITAKIEEFKSKMDEVKSNLDSTGKKSEEVKQKIDKTFDDTLNTTGLKNKVEEVKTSLDSTAKKSEEVGQNLNKSFDNNSGIDKMKHSTEELNEKFGVVTKNALRMQKAVAATDRAEARLQALKDKLDKLLSGEVQPKAVKELENELKKAESEAYKLDKRFEELAKQQDKINARPRKMSEKDKKEYTKISAKLQVGKLDKETEKQLKARQKEIKNNSPLTEDNEKEMKALQREMDNLDIKAEELDETIQKINKDLANMKANPETSDEFKSLQEKIGLAEKRLETMQMNEVKVGMQTQTMAGQFSAAMEAMDVAIASTGIGAILIIIGQIIAIVEKLINIVKGAIDKIKKFIEEIKNYINECTEIIINALKKITEVTKQLGKVSAVVASTILKGIGSLISGVAKLAKSFTGIVASCINLKSIATTLTVPFSKFGKMLGSLISSGFTKSISLLGKAFSQLKSYGEEGFTNLLSYSKKTTKELALSVAELQDKLTQFKNSIASAFLPIVDVALPYLKKLVDYLTKVTDSIAQFVAALTGKGTYLKANVVTNAVEDVQNAKAGLASFDKINNLSDDDQNTENMFTEEEVSNKIKDFFENLKRQWEAGDFSELGKQLADVIKNALKSIPWEEVQAKAEKVGKSLATLLNGLFSDLDLAKTLGNTFAEVLNSIVSAINGFLSKFDFGQAGTFTTELLKSFLEGIKWDNIKKAADKLGTGLAEYLNAIFKDKKLAEDIGTSIAEMINTAVTFAKAFLTKFDFKELGTFITTLVKNTLEKINWKDIKTCAEKLGKGISTTLNEIFRDKKLAQDVGKTLGETLNSIFIFAFNTVRYFNFDDLGEWLSTALHSLTDTTGIQLFTQVVIDCINGISTTIAKFFEDIRPFEEIGTRIAVFFNTLGSGVDWEGNAEAVSNGVNAIFAGLSRITSVYDGSFVDGIATFINSAFEGIDWDLVFSTFSNGIIVLFDGIGTFIKDFDITNITDAIGVWLDKTDFNTIGAQFGNIIKNALEKSSEFITNIDWTDVGNKIIELLNGIDFVGIFGKGLELASNLWNAIADLLVSFEDIDFEKIGSDIGEKFNKFLENTDFEKMATGIASLVQGLIDGFCAFLDTVDSDDINDAIDSFFTTLSNNIDPTELETKLGEKLKEIDLQPAMDFIARMAWAGFWTGFGVEKALKKWKKQWKKLPDAVKELFGIHSPSTVFSEIGDFLMQGFINGVSDKIEDVKAKVSEFCNNVLDKVKELFGIHSPSTVMKDIGNNFGEGFNNGIDEEKDTISGTVSDIKDKVTSLFGDAAQGAKDKWSDIKDWASQKKTDVIGGFDGIVDKGKQIFDDLYQKVISPFTNLKEKFKSMFTTVGDGIKEGLKSALNVGIDMINKMIAGINKIQIGLPGSDSKVGFNIPTIPKIALAKGGIVNAPTSALIGEAGKEAVLPLENNTEWMNTLSSKIAMAIIQAQKQNGSNQPLNLDINIGGNRFGKVCVDNINSYHRQIGKVVLEV